MARTLASSPLQFKGRFRRLLPADVILDICRQASHRFRKRKFDPAVTVHLFILQILHGNTAILHLRHLVAAGVNAAAYSACLPVLRAGLRAATAVLAPPFLGDFGGREPEVVTRRLSIVRCSTCRLQ